MSRKLKLACAWTAAMIVTVSCALSFGGGLSEEEKLQTAVAQTMEARETEEDGDEELTPTVTTSPTDTPEGPPTKTPGAP